MARGRARTSSICSSKRSHFLAENINTRAIRLSSLPKTRADVPGEGVAVFALGGVDDSVNVVVHARLRDVHDAFPLDDEAWLVAGVVRKARVLIVTPGNDILRDFFDLEATKKVADITYLTPSDLRDDAKYRGPAPTATSISSSSIAAPRKKRRTCRWPIRSSSPTCRRRGNAPTCRP